MRSTSQKAMNTAHATGAAENAAKNAIVERNSPTLVTDTQPPTALEAGGYSVDEPRTRRALSEDMDVRFASVGPTYEVVSGSGNTYMVDVEAETCTCPDCEQRQPSGGCKHLRRVDLEIRTGITPAPDGTFNR